MPSNSPTSLGGPKYRIGKDDLIEVTVFEAPGTGLHASRHGGGHRSLPLIGPLKAAGHTPQELERSIEAVFKGSQEE